MGVEGTPSAVLPEDPFLGDARVLNSVQALTFGQNPRSDPEQGALLQRPGERDSPWSLFQCGKDGRGLGLTRAALIGDKGVSERSFVSRMSVARWGEHRYRPVINLC
jgi:hypothetical protein